MMYRSLSCLLVVIALIAFVAAPLLAEDKARAADKNTHMGTFVSAKGDKEFTMSTEGKEHSHVLAPDAKIIGADGKEGTLANLKAGQKIRVTTKEGDMKTATRVEVVKEK
jgi:hypothetical protein